MSVALYDGDELCALWHACGGSDELRDVLGVLAYANRAAYLCAYGTENEDLESVYDFDLPRPAPCEQHALWAQNPLTWADNLLYNCVSNGGSNFAPTDRANTLRAAAYVAQRRDQGIPA